MADCGAVRFLSSLVVYGQPYDDLMSAVAYGEADKIRALIEAGVDVNATSDSGSTAIMGASNHGYTQYQLPTVSTATGEPDPQ